MDWLIWNQRRWTPVRGTQGTENQKRERIFERDSDRRTEDLCRDRCSSKGKRNQEKDLVERQKRTEYWFRQNRKPVVLDDVVRKMARSPVSEERGILLSWLPVKKSERISLFTQGRHTPTKGRCTPVGRKGSFWWTVRLSKVLLRYFRRK